MLDEEFLPTNRTGSRPPVRSLMRARGTPRERPALEAEILCHLATGDVHAATDQIIRGYGAEILGFLINTMDDADAAKEVWSETVENMWQGLSTFEPRAPVRTWLYCIARNACARYYRDKYRKRGIRLSTDAQDLLKAVTDSVFADQCPRDSVERIRKLLSPEDREILILRVDRELCWIEIATITGLSPAAARQRFHRVKDKIRGLLDQEKHEHAGRRPIR